MRVLILCAVAGCVSGNLLAPIETSEPDHVLFPPRNRHPLNPVNTEVEGPKHTNKFWGNWVVDDGPNRGYSIFPSPYSIRFREVGDSVSGELQVYKGETDYKGDFYTTHWWPDFNLGTVESLSGSHVIVKEQHFGVHAQVRGPSCTVTYPVFAGMAYVSARYQGGCTPTISSDFVVGLVEKVRPGVFRFTKRDQTPKEYRVYVLTPGGDFVDDSFDFDSNGLLNKQLDGWVRLADLQETTDTVVLDRHANTVLVGWELAVADGVVEYNFETVGPAGGKLLNWAYANHMSFLDAESGAHLEPGLTRTLSPVKGRMFPLVSGNQWRFKVGLSDALAVDFLPNREPMAEYTSAIVAEVQADWEYFRSDWRFSLFHIDHYFSGKGFQKLATICHLMRKFDFNHAVVQECAETLKGAFECMYMRTVTDGSDRAHWSQPELRNSTCQWAPYGTWYDLDWGGIASRGDDSPTCGVDFGNSCYNDHHYHWGYYVVSAAMLLDLMPSMKADTKFINFINMFIRDASNPSPADTYFPQFRAFDWFDMHSWSRGLKASDAGKDQESTSEEVNLHYGVLLWGRMLGNEKMEKLGATMLTVASSALQEYFLNKRDNKNHPASFSRYHVTGIFFQNKVHLTTWFGSRVEYIHGIQMLPLTAGLFLSRTPEFCWEEWEDRLSGLGINHQDPWWSILITGNLAMWDRKRAFAELTKFKRSDMDDGLTKSWALYWISVQPSWNAPVPDPTPAPSPELPPAPTPRPAPRPPAFCAPNQGQMCPPGNIPCPDCGQAACECPAVATALVSKGTSCSLARGESDRCCSERHSTTLKQSCVDCTMLRFQRCSDEF